MSNSTKFQQAVAAAVAAQLQALGITQPAPAKAQEPTPRKGKARKAKASTPKWIVERAIRSDARKALSAKLRKTLGRPYTAAEWQAAKAEAGVA